MTRNAGSLGSLLCPFQSTCPLRGTTAKFSWRSAKRGRISIHVPLAGHDVFGAGSANPAPISIHVPLAGHDAASRHSRKRLRPQFQSTCPLRGTTYTTGVLVKYFSISIHVPLAGHDSPSQISKLTREGFQSTCPLRGTTFLACRRCWFPRISIHVPLAGHDQSVASYLSDWLISIHVPLAGHDGQRLVNYIYIRYFNPRAPCGARREIAGFPYEAWNFNPRAPCGARRWRLHELFTPEAVISIHVPLAGHDCKKAQRILCIFVKTG